MDQHRESTIHNSMSLHLKCHPFQQYFWKSCPNFGGSMSNNFFRCHVQQNLWGGVMSNNFGWPQFRESVSNNILFGEGHLYFQTCGFFPQKNGTPGPRPSKKSLPQKIIDIWRRYPTYGNMGWFTDTNHHAPPGPPVPRHHV